MKNLDTIKEDLKKTSNDLELSFESQDWGIINSDYKRVFEFIDYLEDGKYSNEMKYWLTELIIASINDGLIEGAISDRDLFRLKDFLLNSKSINNTVIQYWSSLINASNAEEFPVSNWLLCEILK
jgi:hypothetical protein